jgi:asparagine synthase (glutamine-hydrolysing)
MCGILGSVNLQFTQSHLDLLKHRGPDDFGLKSFSVNNNTIVLGHRRLSIIDTSLAGHQPMISACGNYAIIFNGEIYNHAELREKLPSDIQYKGYSDTESILYYLIKFGIQSVCNFNGIFSFAFLDIKANNLFLVRDPFGVKPLYFSLGKGNQLIFSSEIKTINSLTRKRSLNGEALATLLRLRYNPSPETLYEGIFKLRPGHLLEVKIGTDLEYKNSSFLVQKHQIAEKVNGSIVSKYGTELESAVQRQLLSDVEVGILLSGGIDSALVAALAQKHYSNKLKAFTIGFEGTHVEDEIGDAEATARALGLEHYYKRISFMDFLGMIKKCSTIVEEPLATTSIIPMYFLSELASSKVKVVLTGQGADEPLGGYTRYKLELLRSKIPEIFQQLIFPICKRIKSKNEQISRGIKAININNDVKRFLATYEIFTDKEIYGLLSKKEILSTQRITYYYDLLNCKTMEHSVERMMALDMHLNLADDLLNYTDKITMYHGLECRVPMLDLKLINFIKSLPVSYKLNLKQGKIIHKKYAEQLLPYEIIHRRKKGFQSPTHLWFKQESNTIKEILLTDRSTFSSIFNQGYVKTIINQHKNGRNREKQIFLLLSIYYFLESYSGNDRM